MKELFGVSAALVILGFWVVVAIGWIINIINFVQALPVFDTIQIARAVGVVLAPLGALLGWFA